MSKRTGLFLAGIVVLMLIGFGLVYAIVHKIDSRSQPAVKPSPALATDFYGALKNAATKQMTRYEYFEIYGDNDAKADKTAQSGTTNPSTDAEVVHGLSEFSTANKELRSVLATVGAGNLGGIAKRCFNGKNTSSGSYQPKLTEIEKATQKAFTRDDVIDDADDAACQITNEGFATGSQHFYHNILIPIGLNQQQADGWVNYMQKYTTFNLTNSGNISAAGKTYHKITVSLNPSDDKHGGVLGQQELVFAVRDGGKVDLHSQGYSYDTDWSPTLGYDGFVLIDESTKLPVYSEFHSKQFPENAKDSNKGKTYTYSKYSYPEALSLTPNDPLTSFMRIQ